MNDSSETPLTDFLIDLCHDTEKLRLFWEQPDSERDAYLQREYPQLRPEHRRLLATGKLGEIQGAIRAEHGDAYAAIWITRPINAPPINEPPPDDEPEEDQYSG